MTLLLIIEINGWIVFLIVAVILFGSLYLHESISSYKIRIVQQETKSANTQSEYEGKIREKDLIIQKIESDMKGMAQEHAQKWFEEWKINELEQHRKVIITAAATQVQSEVAQWKIVVDKEIREDAVKRSMGVNFGKITEHLLPFSIHLQEFDPRDIRFIGSPVDLMIFDGATKKSDKIDIYLVEIKTGTGQLSKKQRTIRDAIESHRVFWKPIVVPAFKWDVPDEDEVEGEGTSEEPFSP